MERGDLTVAQNCIRSSYKDDVSKELKMADDMIQDSGQKLQFGRFGLDMRKNVTQRLVQHWEQVTQRRSAVFIFRGFCDSARQSCG